MAGDQGDSTGTVRLSGSSFGITVFDAPNTVIGGTVAAEANVVAGYDVTGIDVSGAGAGGTQVQGNFVGTDASGTLDLTNGIYGVTLQISAAGVVIGGEVSVSPA